MRLVEVELWNICQHQHLKVSFSAGLTAVVGPNGSGKTNLMTATYAGITGDFSRFELSRQGLISQFAGKAEKAGIRVVLEHGGLTAEIIRMLEPALRSLVIGNEEPITAEKQIVKRIETWFGMPIKTIGQYIFVDQWQMFALLKETPAKRAEDLFRLFNLDKADACNVAIGEQLSDLAVFCKASSATDLDAVRASLMSSRAVLRRLEQELGKIKSIIDLQPSIEELEETIYTWRKKQALLKDVDSLSDEITRYQGIANKLTASHKQTERELATHKLSLDLLHKQIKDIEVNASKWDTYNYNESLKRNKLADLADVEAMLKTPEPTAPPNLIPAAELPKVKESIRTLIEKLAIVDNFLRNITCDTAHCPVCLTPSESFKDKFEEFSKSSKLDRLKLNNYRLAVKNSEQYYLCRNDYEKRRKWLVQDIEKRKADIAKLPDIPKPDVPFATMTEIEESCQLYTAQVEELETTLQKLTNEKSAAVGRFVAADDRLQKLQTELQQITVTEEDVAYCTNTLEACRKASSRYSQLSSEISHVKKSITDKSVELEEAEEAIKFAKKLEDWKAELIAVRSIVHRDALPKMIAQSHLDGLEDQMNESLAELGIDFRVKSKSSELAFDVIFNDGIRKLPAEALSGGEKVVFALAWRLAVNAKFSSDIGVLCLDEPTAGLDKDRLDCLRLAVEQMKKMSTSRGLQCIIITHAEDLMPLFDNVIELKIPVPKEAN